MLITLPLQSSAARLESIVLLPILQLFSLLLLVPLLRSAILAVAVTDDGAVDLTAETELVVVVFVCGDSCCCCWGWVGVYSSLTKYLPAAAAMAAAVALSTGAAGAPHIKSSDVSSGRSSTSLIDM